MAGGRSSAGAAQRERDPADVAFFCLSLRRRSALAPGRGRTNTAMQDVTVGASWANMNIGSSQWVPKAPLKAVYGSIGLSREMRRRRIGRLPGRWEDALVAAWGPDWANGALDLGAIIDVVVNSTVLG